MGRIGRQPPAQACWLAPQRSRRSPSAIERAEPRKRTCRESSLGAPRCSTNCRPSGRYGPLVADHQISKGRGFAAWLGLTPLNRSSAGKERLGHISKIVRQHRPHIGPLLVFGHMVEPKAGDRLQPQWVRSPDPAISGHPPTTVKRLFCQSNR